MALLTNDNGHALLGQLLRSRTGLYHIEASALKIQDACQTDLDGHRAKPIRNNMSSHLSKPVEEVCERFEDLVGSRGLHLATVSCAMIFCHLPLRIASVEVLGIADSFQARSHSLDHLVCA